MLDLTPEPILPIRVVSDPDFNRYSIDRDFLLWLALLSDSKTLHDLPAEAYGWTDGQMMLAMLLLGILGKDSISDLAALDADRDLCRLIREMEPEILGMSEAGLASRFRGKRRRIFPTAKTAQHWLMRFQGTAEEPDSARKLQVFEKATSHLASFLIRMRDLKELTLDLDAPVIGPSGRSHRPIMVFCPKLEMVLHSGLYGGDTPVSAHGQEILERVLSWLPPEITRMRVHFDGDVFEKKLADFCNDPESRPKALRRFGVIGFAVEVRQDAGLREALTKIPKARWSPVSDSDPGFECACLSHASTRDAGRDRSRPSCHIGTRRALPRELGIGLDELPATDGNPAYRCQVYLTNMTSPEVPGEKEKSMMSPSEVVRFAHEQSGDDRKSRTAVLQDMVDEEARQPGQPGANSGWWQLAILAVNINAIWQTCVFKTD